MNTARRITRRGFLLSSGTGLIALSGFATTGCDVLILPDARAVARELTGLLHRRGMARRIGRAYIDSNDPAAPSLETLTRALLASLGIDLDDTTLLPAGNLIRALSGRVRRDFAEERVVVLDGWVLSRAETQVCGILYLYDA